MSYIVETVNIEDKGIVIDLVINDFSIIRRISILYLCSMSVLQSGFFYIHYVIIELINMDINQYA